MLLSAHTSNLIEAGCDEAGRGCLAGPVYAAAVITAPAATTRMLYLGSDYGVLVWLNDRLVHRNLVERGVTADDDRVEVNLKKGRNLLLLKIDQGHGDVGFTVRIVDPPDELSFSLPE